MNAAHLVKCATVGTTSKAQTAMVPMNSFQGRVALLRNLNVKAVQQRGPACVVTRIVERVHRFGAGEASCVGLFETRWLQQQSGNCVSSITSKTLRSAQLLKRVGNSYFVPILFVFYTISAVYIFSLVYFLENAFLNQN